MGQRKVLQMTGKIKRWTGDADNAHCELKLTVTVLTCRAVLLSLSERAAESAVLKLLLKGASYVERSCKNNLGLDQKRFNRLLLWTVENEMDSRQIRYV